jgi:hypothetical protein
MKVGWSLPVSVVLPSLRYHRLVRRCVPTWGEEGNVREGVCARVGMSSLAVRGSEGRSLPCLVLVSSRTSPGPQGMLS